jgi:hypothetical protein
MGDDAEPAAGQALELYLAADPEDRAVGGIAGARIDLATARLLNPALILRVPRMLSTLSWNCLLNIARSG